MPDDIKIGTDIFMCDTDYYQYGWHKTAVMQYG